MDDLITWLRAQIDEDEQGAKRAASVRPEWVYDRERFRVLTAGGQQELVNTDGTQHPDRWVIAAGTPDCPLADVDGEHIARHDPARVLREVEAKRKIIDWCVEVIGDRDLSRYGEPGALRDDLDPLTLTLAVETLRSLATVYSDRPGYREEW